MSNHSCTYPCGCIGYAYDNGRLKDYSHELTHCPLHGAAPELLAAVRHLLQRIQQSPSLAYYFDPATESLQKLTDAYATATGEDVETFRKRFMLKLRFKAPRCTECACKRCQEGA